MRILTKYVLKELVQVFLLTLIAMTMLLLLLGVTREALDQGLGLTQIMLLVPYVLPDAMRFAVPFSILLSTSYTYGRMSSTNEIVALKSMGISAMSVLWPAFILAFLLSLSAVWLNDLAVSWGRKGVQRVIIESVEEVAYRTLRIRRSYRTSRFAITVTDVVGRRLISPTLSFKSSGSKSTSEITADWAKLRADLEKNELIVVLYNASIYSDEIRMIIPGRYEHIIPLHDGVAKKDNMDNPSHIPLKSIPAAIVKTLGKIQQLEQELAARAAYQMITGELDLLAAKNPWDQEHKKMVAYRQRLARLYTEPHRRWANGFSCLCFVLVGAPLAILLRNSDFLTSFFVCFLPILILYYPFVAYGLGQAKTGTLPSYSVWLGNVILIFVSMWLLRRVLRY